MVSRIKWYRFDIKAIKKLEPFEDPDLSRVEEIGFTDLKKGGGSHQCSRVDWIEVWGQSVKKT